jgi:hypothetical protein
MLNTLTSRITRLLDAALPVAMAVSFVSVLVHMVGSAAGGLA